MQSVEADQPWDHVQIDLIGPLFPSDAGMTQVFTVVNVLSGFIVLRALKDKAMDTVARALWKIFYEFGTPKIIQSDNGTEFVNSVMQGLTKLYGVDHRLITPYHPRANGLVERVNKEVGKGLKKRLVGAKKQ